MAAGGETLPSGTVVAVASSAEHHFSKTPRPFITLLAGLGVDGDCHAGSTVQHLSRIAKDPTVPNLRQVHLIHAELLNELAAQGFSVGHGQLGENILTRGIDLLALPTGTRLHFGADAVVRITGLRNPCRQIDGLQKGLMAATLDHDSDGQLIRKAGVMAVVETAGRILPNDPIGVTLPARPWQALACV